MSKVIGKNAVVAAITISSFQRACFDLALSTHKAVDKAQESMRVKMIAQIKSKYAEVAPTYLQFRTDRRALAHLAKEKGLVNDQHVRKPFNAAIIAVFGALPEAQTAAAIAKRKIRAATGTVTKVVSSDSENADQPAVGARNASASEQIEQQIAKWGIAATLSALTKLLAVENSTKAASKLVAAANVSLKKASMPAGQPSPEQGMSEAA